VGLPLGTLLWFRRTRRPLALIGYALSSGWVIIGFGLIDGLWKSTLKLFLGNFLLANYAQYFSWAPVGSFPFEASGILASISGILSAYYTVRFLQAAPFPISVRARTATVAALAATALGVVVVVSNRRPALPREGGVIRIGVIVPKKGLAAILGDSFLKAVELSRENLPKTKYRYELVIADTGNNAVQTRRAIQKLIGEDKVQARPRGPEAVAAEGSGMRAVGMRKRRARTPARAWAQRRILPLSRAGPRTKTTRRR
ncbi:MAG: ABC transporter substrate-binding protein, partial [Usitatibacter sp.]